MKRESISGGVKGFDEGGCSLCRSLELFASVLQDSEHPCEHLSEHPGEQPDRSSLTQKRQGFWNAWVRTSPLTQPPHFG